MSRKYKKRNMASINSMSPRSYIKKYFGNEIRKILNPSNKSLQLVEYPYVHHAEAESIILDMIEPDEMMDKSLIFTGLTGSGKTTILSQVLGYTTNSNRAEIKDNTLIVPIDFNRYQQSAETAILSSLRSAINKLCQRYSVDYPEMDNEGFQDFAEQIRPDGMFLISKETSRLTKEDRMAYWQEQMPIPYVSCQLQYVLGKPECGVDLVLMVVDNVEAFSSNKKQDKEFFEPVIKAFQLAECIQKRQQPTKWSYNLIIACRHYVWRMIKGDKSLNKEIAALLESYITSDSAYDLAKPVRVNDIVHEREKVFSARQKNKEAWEAAVITVQSMLDSMEGRIGDFILQLNLKNIRSSMIMLQELIQHSGLQRVSDESITDGAFNIKSEDQFDLSRVNLIRTIGLGENRLYSESSTIPNLLFNEVNEGMELYPLLSLKYFLIKCDFKEPDWNNGVSIAGFYTSMKSIFDFDDKTMERIFGGCIKYFFKHRLLLRTADQPQDEVPGLSIEEISKIENGYVSGVAVTLWDELSKSSALFQLYIDDIYLDAEKDYFGNDGNDIEHCYEYLCELVDVEERIFNIAKNFGKERVREYLSCFGDEPVCMQLAEGLNKSLSAISVDGKKSSRANRAAITLQKLKMLTDRLREMEANRIHVVSKQ